MKKTLLLLIFINFNAISSSYKFSEIEYFTKHYEQRGFLGNILSWLVRKHLGIASEKETIDHIKKVDLKDLFDEIESTYDKPDHCLQLERPALDLAISKDNRIFMVDGSDTINIFSLFPEQKCYGHIHVDNCQFQAIAISNDNKLLAAGTRSCEIFIWDMSNLSEPKRSQRLILDNGGVRFITFSPDDKHIFIGSKEVGNVLNCHTFEIYRLWDFNDKAYYYSGCFTSDSSNILTIENTKNIDTNTYIYKNKIVKRSLNDLKNRNSNGELLKKIPESCDCEMASIASNGGDNFIVGLSNGNATVYGKSAQEINLGSVKTTRTNNDIEHAALSKNSYYAACSSDDCVNIWNLLQSGPKPIAKIKHKHPINICKFTPCDKYLISASVNGVINAFYLLTSVIHTLNLEQLMVISKLNKIINLGIAEYKEQFKGKEMDVYKKIYSTLNQDLIAILSKFFSKKILSQYLLKDIIKIVDGY